jgi:hypothetical protein
MRERRVKNAFLSEQVDDGIAVNGEDSTDGSGTTVYPHATD